MIFRPISLFLSFGFAYFHLFIYILPYPHKKNRREIHSPHHLGLLGLHCDYTATTFPLRLRLTPHTAASSYQPSTHYRVFYRISIASHHIALHCAPHIVTSRR